MVLLLAAVDPASRLAASEPVEREPVESARGGSHSGGTVPSLGSKAPRAAPPRADDPRAQTPRQDGASAPDRQREAIVDLRLLPVVSGARFLARTAAELEMVVPLDPMATFDFYEKALAREGWTVVASSRKATAGKNARAYFEKGGGTLSLSVAVGESSNTSEAALRDRGDFDTERLPRLAGSEIASRSRPLTVFLTNESAAVAAEALSRFLAAAGWHSYRELDAGSPSAGSRTLWFRRSRDSLTVSIVGSKTAGAKTRVSYSVRRLAHPTPTPPDAKDVELNDAKWQVRCRAPGDLNAVAEYYRQVMAPYGFKAAAASSVEPGEKLLRFEGLDRSAVLVNLASKGPMTAVSLQGMSAEQLTDSRAVAERTARADAAETLAVAIYAQDLPLPAGAREVRFAAKEQEITFRSPAALDAVIEELRAKLKAAGWREKSDASLIADGGGMTEFQRGDASLLIMLDQTTQGSETEVTITGKGIVWR